MIQDEVLQGRIPRLGSITIGRGVEATSQKGNTYGRPTKSQTLVFHTNDPELANAVQMSLGGDIKRDSPTWDYDVVTDVREAEVVVLAPGFRQMLEVWRAAECVRRCDGITMSTAGGRPVSQPCACDPEIERGAERACKPHTILPVLVDLDAERFGVWEIRSTSWGTAAAIKGTMRALAMVGANQASVPAILSMVDRTVRDATGQVRDITEMHVTIAQSHQALSALAGQAAALDGPAPASLPSGGEDAERLSLMQDWSSLHARAHGIGLRDQLANDWLEQFGPGREFDDLDLDELRSWVALVRATVEDHEEILRRERADAEESQEEIDGRDGIPTGEDGARSGDSAEGGGSPPEEVTEAPAGPESV